MYKGEMNNMNNKSRRTLHLVAGIYLFYLAFQLLSGLGQNGNKAVSLVGGIVFIGIGIFLLFNYFRCAKKDMEAEANEEVEETVEVIEEVKEEE